MEIISIKSKALKLLIQKNDVKLLPTKYVQKVRDIIDILAELETIEEFLKLPRGRPHRLKGSRPNTYAVSVYANWRITFEYIAKDNSVHILDFEDYH